MNEISRKKFLIKLSDESQFRILSRNSDICILKVSVNGGWSEIAQIKGMHPCFYADVDSRDCINIVSQDLKGSVIYSKIEKNKIISYKVLRSSISAAFDRSFFMLYRNDSPVFFYTVRKQADTTLVSQTFSGKTVPAPIPLVKVPDAVNPYWITQLDHNTGLILFPKVSGLYTQICAGKVRLDMPGIVSEKIVTKEEANCESPKCITLSDGSIHMLYSIRKNGRYYIKYQKGSIHSLDFTDSDTIAVSRQSFTKYNLEYSNSTLNINWLENGYIYFRNKKADEKVFSDIQAFKSYRLRSMEYYHFKCSRIYKSGKCASTELPLSLEAKVQYAFYREEINRPISQIKKKVEAKPENETLPSSINAIFRALTEYLSSRDGFSTDRQKDIQRIGDIAFQLSKLYADLNHGSVKQEKKAEPPINFFKLRKAQGSHKYTLRKNLKA